MPQSVDYVYEEKYVIPTLVGWKERRSDARAQQHWDRIASERPLRPWERFQRRWNFIETDYSYRPSNNGLDPANPAFAFATKLAKHIKIKEITMAKSKPMPMKPTKKGGKKGC